MCRLFFSFFFPDEALSTIQTRTLCGSREVGSAEWDLVLLIRLASANYGTLIIIIGVICSKRALVNVQCESSYLSFCDPGSWVGSMVKNCMLCCNIAMWL